MPYVTPTIPAHLLILADNMREDDRQELAASSGDTPFHALVEGYINSTKCFTIMNDEDQLVGIFGVSTFPGTTHIGHPWMLATDLLSDIKITFLRQCDAYVAELREGFDLLTNVCDKRNRLHIRWLKWLGFKFINEIPKYGVGEQPFLEFVMLGDNHV